MKLKPIEYDSGEALLIKYYRLLRNLSQEELAKKCGRTVSFVCEAEGGNNITRKTRLILAEALEVEPWELCKFDDLDKLRDTVNKMEIDFLQKRGEVKKKPKAKRKKRCRKKRNKDEDFF